MTHDVKKAAESAPQSPIGVAAADGILPVQAIRALISGGALIGSEPIEAGQLQPASVDLRLGPKAYRVRASFLPGPGGAVADRLDDLKLHEFDIENGAVLETGCVYVVPLLESLRLPSVISASANPKSSTGRLDVFTRVIADGVSSFDLVPAGYRGPLYAEICPQTFPIVVRKGSKLSQLRFRHGDPRERMRAAEASGGARRWSRATTADIHDGIALSVALVGDGDGLVGYRAASTRAWSMSDRPGACAVADYWEPVRADAKQRLILDPDQFYILASKEAVHIPPTHCRGDDAVQSARRRIPRALCGLHGSGLRAFAGRWRRISRGAGSAFAHGAVHSRGRADHRAARLRAHDGGAGDPLRPRPRQQLPGARAEAEQALQVGRSASVNQL